MARYKDLSDPALAAELRRLARERPEPPTAPLSITAPPESPANAPPLAAVPAAGPHTFAAVIGAVNPLATPRRSLSRPRPPSPHPRQRTADDASALHASRIATNPSPMAWDVGLDIEAAQSFVRAGLNPDLLRKLRRGDWVVQGSLDLHRHTQEEARIALGTFLAAAKRQGWRCVRIVHGKGLSSPNREPVLKARVRKWLQQRDEVLAYCEPRPHAGGSGAVVVLLSGRD